MSCASRLFIKEHFMNQHLTTYPKRAANAILAIMLLAGFCFTQNAVAQTRPDLGAASTFAVFTGSGAINITGASVLTGDVGYNTGSLTGLPPGTLTGTKHLGDATAAQALQ